MGGNFYKSAELKTAVPAEAVKHVTEPTESHVVAGLPSVKVERSPLALIGIIDLYLFLWKMFLAGLLFAIPFAIIYALIQSR